MRRRLALARVNYSQLYDTYDGGKTFRARDVLIPYQLLNLAAFVRQQDVAVRIFDGEVSLLSEEALAREIAAWQPDVAGFTATTPDIDLTLDVCRRLAALDPRITTVVGGSHASVRPEDVAAAGGVDYVVAGDGEELLARIVARDPQLPPPPGAILRGGPVNLAAAPLPAHDLLDYADYRFSDPTRGFEPTASIMSSRGCPFACTFCVTDRRVRYRTIESFVAEVEYLYHQKGVRYFFVYDDVFLLDRARVLEILRRLRAADLAEARYQCQTRAHLVDPDVLRALHETGFVRVSLGVESGSDEMLARCRKRITRADCLEATRRISAAGMEARASFIIGHPYETHETARATIEFAKELDVYQANFTVMTPYPGTEVYEQACRGEGIRFVRPELAHEWRHYRRWGQPIIRTDALSAEDLTALREQAIVEFYAQPRIHDYYAARFAEGVRARYYFRPLNFAWRQAYGRDLPFWHQLDPDGLVDPAEGGV